MLLLLSQTVGVHAQTPTGEDEDTRSASGETSGARDAEEAASLVEEALEAIEELDFQSARDLLEEAVRLDPKNARARDLYVSVVEASRAERTSRRAEPATLPDSGGDPDSGMAPDSGADGADPSAAAEPPPRDAPDRETPEVSREARESSLSLRVGPELTFARSNAVEDLDSNASLAGARVNAAYYPALGSGRFGASLDYSGGLLKMSGEERIRLRLHRLTVSALARWVFESDGAGGLTAGVRGSYHLFLMENLEEAGAYNFTRLYGPAAGVFLEDPVLSRFIDAPFLEPLRLTGGAGLQYLPGDGDEAPVVPWQFRFGVEYRLPRVSYGIRFRHYRIGQEELQERFNDIAVTVGYEY